MDSETFRGTGVAMITPFNNNGEVDFDALEKLTNYLIDNGVDYLVVLGTTAEAATLNCDEKNAVVSFIKKVNNNRLPIVLGIGGNNTAEIIQTINKTDFSSISGLLSVAPYYNKPGQQGIFMHYTGIAEASPVPVILYNVPGRTGVNMSAETTLKLAYNKNIIAVKEASGDIDQISYIIKNKPENFLVLSGDDALALPLVALGADGIISVTANTLPKDFSNLVKLALNNNIKEAREMHYRLLELFQAMFEEGNPVGVKAALSSMNIIENNLRLPLVKASETLYHKMEGLLKNFKS
jgi:4-hydroxy-tetrahydrodipicolinate synthase